MGCRGSSDETAQHRFRDLLALATTAAVGLLGWKAYQRLVRPHVLNWGATPEEVLQALPGDELLPEVQTQTTRAIAVDATPEQVWPWLAQMGLVHVLVSTHTTGSSDCSAWTSRILIACCPG